MNCQFWLSVDELMLLKMPLEVNIGCYILCSRLDVEEIERWERQESPSKAMMELITRISLHDENWFQEFVIALKHNNNTEALDALDPMLTSASKQSVNFFSSMYCIPCLFACGNNTVAEVCTLPVPSSWCLSCDALLLQLVQLSPHPYVYPKLMYRNHINSAIQACMLCTITPQNYPKFGHFKALCINLECFHQHMHQHIDSLFSNMIEICVG